MKFGELKAECGILRLQLVILAKQLVNVQVAVVGAGWRDVAQADQLDRQLLRVGDGLAAANRADSDAVIHLVVATT